MHIVSSAGDALFAACIQLEWFHFASADFLSNLRGQFSIDISQANLRNFINPG
jgi:hypothetical protein